MSSHRTFPFRAWAARTALLAGVCLAAGCSKPKTSLDAHLGDGDFAFLMGWGSGMYGFRVLRVAADGEASYLYRRDDRWWLVKFHVSAESLAALRKKLDEVGYFALAPRYSIGAIDGDQWFVKARVGERRHAVYLDNEFPPQAEALSDFVRQTMLPQANGSRGEPVAYAEAMESEPLNANDVP